MTNEELDRLEELRDESETLSESELRDWLYAIELSELEEQWRIEIDEIVKLSAE